MIKETDLQLDVVKAVISAGGMATKLSNRFLIGVSDLLVKLPNRPAQLVEVKKNSFVKLTDKTQPCLDITKRQLDFLRSYYEVGIDAGVLSFVLTKRGKSGQVMGVYLNIAMIDVVPYCLELKDYIVMGKGGLFSASIVELLKGEHDGTR